MSNLEDAIRERAYQLWIADGQPEGKADIHWLTAQREILTFSFKDPTATAAAVETIEAKPAKRTRRARYGRSKTRAA